MSKLDQEEREVLQAYENDKTQRASNADETRKRHQDSPWPC